jgi:hypothetical protein
MEELEAAAALFRTMREDQTAKPKKIQIQNLKIGFY